jgi:tRNA1Val (adenine37-N6)-methyltransferase
MVCWLMGISQHFLSLKYMSTSTFQFKQFTIHQDQTEMKVGTDGVLLGAWAPVPDSGRILDVGTGTGIIALMAAQRSREAHITAVEMNPEAAQQARENVARSPWPTRIDVQQLSFQEFVEQTDLRFSDIISNPPFFTETTESPNQERARARQANYLPMEQLMAGAAKLLEDKGRLSLIYPYKSDTEVQAAATKQRLFCSDLCEVRTTAGKEPKRMMAVFRRKVPDYVFRRETLVIHAAGGVYSEAYRALTKDFYLDK